MLSAELNERLTRVGAGTPMGTLMRRYWHPIAASVELDKKPTKLVRILGEDMVLYRDRSGTLGLIDVPCPHRRVSMLWGIPEEEGLRCPYHGWVMNHEGRCLEQPGEPWDSTFKDRIRTKSYPVQELTGLIFAYLGTDPVPLLPNYDLFVWDNVIRHIGVTMLPCNWMQCMENSLDPVHVEWLHGYYMDYLWTNKDGGVNTAPIRRGRHAKIGFDRFEHGMIKRRVVEGNTEDSDPWREGHPVVFPNILRVGGSGSFSFQYRVPVDDTHTMHVVYTCYRPGVPIAPQHEIPMYEIPLRDETGDFLTEVSLVQDFWAWSTQGEIASRELEKLGQSDVGVIMYREMLTEQLDKLERGEEPMEVYRNPAENKCIRLPQEGISYDARMRRRIHGSAAGYRREQAESHFSPIYDEVQELFEEARRRVESGHGEILPPLESPEYEIDLSQRRVVQILPPT
jgi:5,5'-dehydrodivanillate O-demethylase oxygenase subunit